MPTSTSTKPDATTNRRGAGRRESDSQHEQLARLLGQVREGILCIDHNWIVTFANEEAFRRSQIVREDINRNTFWQIYPYNIGTDLDRALRGAMETGEAANIEYFCPTIGIWIYVQICPTDEGLAVYYQDITERKHAEALRDTSVRQLEQVLEATTDAVVSISREWNFTFLNRRAKELLAVNGDLIGKNLWAEFPITQQGSYRYHAERAMNERISGEFEAFYPAPLYLWLSIQTRPSDDGIVFFVRDITARKESELLLKQQQELLAVVQRAALVATWDIDLSTGKVTFGPGSYSLAGYAPDEVSTLESFLKLVEPSHIPLIERAISQTVATGETIVMDVQVVLPDGSLIWIENRGNAVVEDGVPIRLHGLSIDITERKRNEEALRTSEARYRVLADLNPNAIWMSDPTGHTTYANHGLLDYLGSATENLSTQNLLEAIHPDDRQRIVETWQRTAGQGRDFDIEARVVRASDGNTRWWWIRAQPIRDESGAILNWLGVGIDIDDRKTFADALQQRQEETESQRVELETIYQTAPVGLSLFDPVEFRYIRINDRQCETLGLPREKVLGRTITELAPLKGIREIFERVAQGHFVRNLLLEGELPTRPGVHRYWNVSYSPIRDANGAVRAIIAVVLEITHQKKAEAALIQSEKLAAVGRLASSISHEINNPLEAITNLLYLVALSDDLPNGIRNYVQIAQAELARVCQIATQTLRFHRQAVRATHVSAADLVGAVLNLYQGRLANSSIMVEASYATKTTILCFENDIRQVLNNLIANAIDAMRHGGRLFVRAHDAMSYSAQYPEGRSGIRISIADTGHGMSPAVRARVFEPFYTTKDLNGTGLGLWISAGIVSRHHGRLTFRSSQDPKYHGTVFSLFLPRVEVPIPVEFY